MGEQVDRREPAMEIGSPARLGLGKAYLRGLLIAAGLTVIATLIAGAFGLGPGDWTLDTVSDAGSRILYGSLFFCFLLLLNDRQRIKWARLGSRGVQLQDRPLLRWDEIQELQVVWLRRRWGVPLRGPAAGATHAKIRLVPADAYWLARTIPKGGGWFTTLARHSVAATGPVLTLPITTAEHARSIVDLADQSADVHVRQVSRGERFHVDVGWPGLVRLVRLVSLLVLAVFAALMLAVFAALVLNVVLGSGR
jgi:hypothetical protein